MSHGFEFRNAAGNVSITMDDAMPRLVHSQRFANGFSGTISVPDFDSDKGMFYVSPCAVRQTGPYNLTRDDTADYPDSFTISCNGKMIPDLSWDNTTKVMTINPTVFPYYWPSNEPYFYDYYLNFLALNKRFIV